MIQVIANLGFFWKELPLEQRFIKAREAGFRLIETHDVNLSPDEMARLTKAAGISHLGLNAFANRDSLTHALEVCKATGATNLHIMPGDVHPRERLELEAKFVPLLAWACELASKQGVTVLLEALNPIDRPAYFYHTLAQSVAIIAKVGADNLKIMADIYHIARAEGDVFRKLTRYQRLIGHVQVAGVPDRREIDKGEIYYPAVFAHLHALGLTQPIGLEYIPEKSVEAGLSYMQPYGLSF